MSFADRQASKQAASTTDTQVALAELYAHVSRMPESAKKRKILKQVGVKNTFIVVDIKTCNTFSLKQKCYVFCSALSKIIFIFAVYKS